MTQMLTVKQAARVTTLAPQTLNNMRVTGRGPPFHKFGRRVAYAEDDLQKWMALRRAANTQQAIDNCGKENC